MKHFVTWMMVFCLGAPGFTAAQLITMSNKCFDRVKTGNKQLDSAQFESALHSFDNVLQDCSAKDAKEQASTGKARALNGLKRYDEAIGFANTAIKLSKEKNVMAYYTRSYAYKKTGKADLARTDLEKVTELTTKNRDVKARATMFAQLADVDFQEGMEKEANDNLAKAIELDPQNAAFYVQRGDMQAKGGNYDEAFKDYDHAVSLGMNGVSMYTLRTEARIQQMQQKYHTENANELAKKMDAGDKALVCGELGKALDMGLRNMQLDLFSSMICK